MQQELEARRQDIIAKERSLDQAEAAAEKRWAKLTEDVSAKVVIRVHVIPGMHSSSETLRTCCAVHFGLQTYRSFAETKVSRTSASVSQLQRWYYVSWVHNRCCQVLLTKSKV